MQTVATFVGLPVACLLVVVDTWLKAERNLVRKTIGEKVIDGSINGYGSI